MSQIGAILPAMVCTIAVATSIIVWVRLFPQEEAQELMKLFQTWYVMALGFFLMISTFPRMVMLLFKIAVRLLFTVWVIAFVAMSTMDHAQQMAYNIVILLLVGYVEACFDVYDEIKDISRTNRVKSALITASLRWSRALTLAAVSLAHICIAFMFRDVFERLFG